MMRRLASILLALAALFAGVTVEQTVVAPQPAAADGIVGSIIGGGIHLACDGAIGPVASLLGGDSLCKKLGDAGGAAVDKAFQDVWNSVLGDWIKSGQELAKSAIKSALTLALSGPSLDLQDTGLWNGNATLAGMLVWLGLVVATVGFIWQIGKMAITGQTKHLGRSAVGWAQNVMLSLIGLTVVALLLSLGDEITSGLVSTTFGSDSKAYDRILAVMVPEGIANPALVGGGVLVLLLVGFIQMILVFLRQSAIPIQCLLLPIAGAGRVGGDSTRQWAPKLIVSILTTIAYKPLLAVIICTGFSEFGSSVTLAEWLRGCATLFLAILAPGPLMKVFGAIGADVGGGMAMGGMLGAVGMLGEFGAKNFGGSGGSGGRGGDAKPTDAVQHAQYVEQNMPKHYDPPPPPGGGGGGDDDPPPPGGGGGSPALNHASRNESTSTTVPGASTPGAGTPGAGTSGTGAGGGAATGAGGAAAGVGIAVEILDGVNSAVHKASDEMGGGEKK